MFVVLSLLNPPYMEPLYNTTTGNILLGAAIAGLLLGAWMMSRLARIRW
jgi:Flp pilus assembly protein TadB